MAGLSVPLDEAVHFDVVMHSPTTGGISDGDSAPTFDVFEEATDTPILDDQTMTKRTSLTGNYRGAFTASTANGFEVGKYYIVIATGTVGGVTGKVPALIFRCVAAEHTAGYPVITIKDGTGTGEINTNAGAVAVVDLVTLTATATTLTNAPADSAGVTTLLSRIPAALFSGITSLAHWLGLLAGKQTPNATALTEIKATGAGSGTYDATTDSQEAIRDRGDASWGTATGFSTLDAAGVRTAVGLASANLDTQLADLPTNAELTTALTNLDAAVSTRATPAQVNAEADTALSDVGVTLARMGALTDWIDGGRLDLLLDGVVADNPNRPAIGVELPNFMFLMVDATDLNTPETGITVTATISKDGGAFAACTNAVSEVSGGWYKITLTSTEMNATSIAVKFTGTGCAQRNIAIRTQPT